MASPYYAGSNSRYATGSIGIIIGAILLMTKTQLMTRLTENAIDFLTRAVDDFKIEPKYSIINFYTAVELFLKARLLHEHWSLVVLKDPERQKFEAGDFISVSFESACERLQKVVQSAIPDIARKNFDVIRKHRNKMVHFFHVTDRASDENIAAIAEEQLRAWYDLNKLLTIQWSGEFISYRKQFTLIGLLPVRLTPV